MNALLCLISVFRDEMKRKEKKKIHKLILKTVNEIFFVFNLF